MNYVNERDVARPGADTAAARDRRSVTTRRSPRCGPPTPPFPVYLLHGTDDNVIPAVESVLLAANSARAWRRSRAAGDAAHYPRRGRSVRRGRARSGTSWRSGPICSTRSNGLTCDVSRATTARCTLSWAAGLRDSGLGTRSWELEAGSWEPFAAMRFKAAISRSSRSRNSPGRIWSSLIGPMRTRFRRLTGCPIASHIRRTWRLRPS